MPIEMPRTGQDILPKRRYILEGNPRIIMKYLLKGRKKPPKGQEEETWHTCPRTYYPAPESERWTYNKRLQKTFQEIKNENRDEMTGIIL